MLSLLNSLALIWLTVAAAFCAALFVRTVYILIATPVVRASQTIYNRSNDSMSVSILLPVRNEVSRVLRANLESLTSQTHEPLEIIAVDDRSTDNSLHILRRYERLPGSRLRVVLGQKPPNGWSGKTFALQQAKTLSKAEWLLFVDADVVYSPRIIDAALAFVDEHHLDALSLLPRVEMQTFWEMVTIPVIAWLSLMRVSTTQANRRGSKKCFGYGNFILVRRTAHDAIGGFEDYKDDILDDCAVMERLKSNGYRVMIADGSEVMSSRMYSSFREIQDGFGKNTFAALRFSVTRATAVLSMIVCFALLPPVYLAYEILMFNTLMGLSGQMAVLAASLLFFTMLCFGLRMRVGPIFFACYLLGNAVALIIIAYSTLTFKIVGGMIWKGRILSGARL